MTPLQRQQRFADIAAIGCIACLRFGYHGFPDVHHLNLGGHAGQKRMGDEYTIGLDPWHHRGVPPFGMTRDEARAELGPSLALEPRKFRETFGSDAQLLMEQNARILELRSRRVA